MQVPTTSTFDALVPGASWRSAGRTLGESDLAHACMTSGDWHPIHADGVYAAGTPLGQRIFQGTYGLHVAVGMASAFPPVADDVIGALGLSEWRYQAPLFVGDTVHVEVEIVAKRRTSDGGRGVLERRIRLIKQDGSVAQQGLVQTLLKAAPLAPAAVELT